MGNGKSNPVQFESLSFGQRLSERRKELGITQEKIAKIMGISTRTYIRYENKDSPPPLSVAVLLSYLLEFSLDDLWNLSKDDKILIEEKKKKIVEVCKYPELLTVDTIPFSNGPSQKTFAKRQLNILLNIKRLLKRKSPPMSSAAKNEFLSRIVFCFTENVLKIKYNKTFLYQVASAPLLSSEPISNVEQQLQKVENWEQKDLVPLVKSLAIIYSHYCKSCEEIERLRGKYEPLYSVEDISDIFPELAEKNEQPQKESNEHDIEIPGTNSEDVFDFDLEDLLNSPENLLSQALEKSP